MTPTKSAMEIEDGHFTKQTPAPCQRMHAAGLYGSSGHLQTSTKGLHASQVLFKWRVAASRNSHQRSVSACMLPGCGHLQTSTEGLHSNHVLWRWKVASEASDHNASKSHMAFE